MTPPRPYRRLCPSCQGACPLGKYLCSDCWWHLPPGTRQALSRRDRKAAGRLQALYRHLEAGAPLDTIAISP